MPWLVRIPAIDAVCTRYPLPRASIPGSTARTAYTWPMTLIAHCSFQTSGSVVRMSPPVATPGVAETDVDRPEAAGNLGDHRVHRLLVADVGPDRDPADLGGDRPATIPVAIDHGKPSTRGGERPA